MTPLLQTLTRPVLAFAAAAAVVAVAVSCQGSDSRATSPADIELRGVDGSPTSISAHLDTRPMLVSLWAVWCQPCRRELPELDDLSTSDVGVDVLAVNVGDDPGRIEHYLSEMSLDLPVAIDPLGDLLTALGVSSVPATILFDERGAILWSHLGAVTPEQVEVALDTFVVQK